MGNTALSGGGLAVIPLQSNYPDGGVHVFYQRDDNTMVEIKGNTSAGWSTGMASPPLAALSKRCAHFLTFFTSPARSQHTKGFVDRGIRSAQPTTSPES